MRIKPDRTLDPSDSYTSDWIGRKPGYESPGEPVELNGNGRPVVGFRVSRGLRVTAIGLIYADQ